MIHKLIKEFQNFWNYFCPKQIEENHIQPILKSKKDLEFPNLFIDKIIDDGRIKAKVLDVYKNNIHVKILEINNKHMATYLNVGKIYPVFKHAGWNDKEIQVWEIAAKHLKRKTSQLILQWEEGIGWNWGFRFLKQNN